MPTAPSGAIDETVMRERLAATPLDDLSIYDERRPDCRAGQSAGPWPTHPAWDDPRTYTTIEKRAASTMVVLSNREMGMTQTARLYAMVFPLLWPHYPEQAVSDLFDVMLSDIDREPSWSTPSILAGMCAWLATANITMSPAAGAACALALAAKSDDTVSVAQSLLRAHRTQREWSTIWVPRAIAATALAGITKLRRVGISIAPLLADESAFARDVTLATLPANHRMHTYSCASLPMPPMWPDLYPRFRNSSS